MNGRVTHTIRIDAQVAAILRQRARPGETPNVVIRRVGADEEAARDARALGFVLVGLPGRRAGDRMRSRLVVDVEEPVPGGRTPELSRNRAIVGRVDEMVAAPESDVEVLRSGTWATVRYSRRAGRPVAVVGRAGELL